MFILYLLLMLKIQLRKPYSAGNIFSIISMGFSSTGIEASFRCLPLITESVYDEAVSEGFLSQL